MRLWPIENTLFAVHTRARFRMFQRKSSRSLLVICGSSSRPNGYLQIITYGQGILSISNRDLRVRAADDIERGTGDMVPSNRPAICTQALVLDDDDG